jgi:hypothetical protein
MPALLLLAQGLARGGSSGSVYAALHHDLLCAKPPWSSYNKTCSAPSPPPPSPPPFEFIYMCVLCAPCSRCALEQQQQVTHQRLSGQDQQQQQQMLAELSSTAAAAIEAMNHAMQGSGGQQQQQQMGSGPRKSGSWNVPRYGQNYPTCCGGLEQQNLELEPVYSTARHPLPQQRMQICQAHTHQRLQKTPLAAGVVIHI